MAETALERRFLAAIEGLHARHRDPEAFVAAGELADQLGRSPEAFLYFSRALEEDPSLKPRLLSRLRLTARPEDRERLDKLAARPSNFEEAIRGVWKWPWRSWGTGVLIMGGIVVYGLRFLFGMLGGIAGMAGPIASSVMVAYLFAFLLKIVRDAATGEDDVLYWPDIGGGDALFKAFFLFYFAMVAAFGPALAASIGLPRSGILPEAPPLRGALVFLLALAGAMYFPIGLLATAVYDRFLIAFRYPRLIASIVRGGRPYVRCVLLAWVCLGGLAVATALGQWPWTFYSIGPVLVVLELYFWAVFMRTVGLFYRYERKRLAWPMEP